MRFLLETYNSNGGRESKAGLCPDPPGAEPLDLSLFKQGVSEGPWPLVGLKRPFFTRALPDPIGYGPTEIAGIQSCVPFWRVS